MANDRRSKKFIPKIRQGTKIITDQDKIMDVFADAYNNILGKASARGHSLELDLLGMLELDLLDLEGIFTEEEVWQVMKEIPPDRAHGQRASLARSTITLGM